MQDLTLLIMAHLFLVGKPADGAI